MKNADEIPALNPDAERLADLKNRMRTIARKDLIGFYENAANFVRMIEKNYKEQGKEARQYKTLHMLIGSTIDNESQPYYDFPEPEYSVEKFIERKEKEGSYL